MSKKIVSIIFVIITIFFGLFTVINNKKNLVTFFESGYNKKAVDALENHVQKSFFRRYDWINIHGLVYKMAGITYVEEQGGTDVYKLNSGDIMYTTDFIDVSEQADSVNELYNYIKNKKNAELLYVQLPFKIKNTDDLPIGAQCYAKENSDKMINALSEKKIPFLDLYSYYSYNAEDYASLFYHTDHHWKPETALDAAGLICKELNVRFGLPYEENLFSIDNYDITTYKNWFLGSLGKRTGKYYSQIDDFNLITPKEETNFSFSADSANGIIERTGIFKDTLIDMSQIETRNLFSLNPYAGYIGGDYKINTVKNVLSDNQTKVLLIRDSYSCALEPFLCMNYKEVTAIDLRYYDEMTLYDYIDSHEFDVLIFAINPTGLGNYDHFRYK